MKKIRNEVMSTHARSTDCSISEVTVEFEPDPELIVTAQLLKVFLTQTSFSLFERKAKRISKSKRLANDSDNNNNNSKLLINVLLL